MAHVRAANELILTGNPDAVQRLLARAGAEVPGLGEKRSLQVGHKGRTLKLGLIATGKDSREIMHQLAAWAKADGVAVRAEPNCAIGRPTSREKGARVWGLDPWDWTESPWDWTESPWDWTESPWDWTESPALPAVASVGADAADGERLFWAQPAFAKIGLTDAAGQRNLALANHQGEGVLVGIFDALPVKALTYSWLTLHPDNVSAKEEPWDDRDLSDHGLMCASLIHAVAPKAQVHLYEVCGKDGHGRLFPLLEAISAFIDLAGTKPAIISLSLGSLCTGGSSALWAMLQKATDQGMVVCAAAGNAAYGTPKVSALLQAQVPAAFPNVIAVSASNMHDGRATYSQRGDIAAPGGEALGVPGPDDAEDIIGMGVSVGKTGYVRMDAGTSFATPLVAGAAALLLEGQADRDAKTYAWVLDALKAGARQPAAAVTQEAVGETLNDCGLGAGILHLPTLF